MYLFVVLLLTLTMKTTDLTFWAHLGLDWNWNSWNYDDFEILDGSSFSGGANVKLVVLYFVVAVDHISGVFTGYQVQSSSGHSKTSRKGPGQIPLAPETRFCAFCRSSASQTSR